MADDAVRLLPVDDESWRLEDYVRRGGYAAARKALTSMTPKDVIAEVRKAGIRGRGGAGFPAGMKWAFVPADVAGPKYLCANADEGEPGDIQGPAHPRPRAPSADRGHHHLLVRGRRPDGLRLCPRRI